MSLDTSRIVARGYAIVKKDDKPLTSTKNITEGDQLTVQMKDGELRSRGEKCQLKKHLRKIYRT